MSHFVFYPCGALGREFSEIRFSNRGIRHGTILGPKGFIVQINDLERPLSLYKYFHDYTIFEMWKVGCATQIQQSAAILVKWSTGNDMKIS